MTGGCANCRAALPRLDLPAIYAFATLHAVSVELESAVQASWVPREAYLNQILPGNLSRLSQVMSDEKNSDDHEKTNFPLRRLFCR